MPLASCLGQALPHVVFKSSHDFAKDLFLDPRALAFAEAKIDKENSNGLLTTVLASNPMLACWRV